MQRIPYILALMALLMGAAVTASADPLIPVAGNVTGVFSNFNPPGCENPVDPLACTPFKTFEGIDVLSGRIKQVSALDWGIRGQDDTLLAQSSILLEEMPFAANAGEDFVLTNLEYRNLLNSAPPMMTVDLNVIMQFTIPNVPQPAEVPFTLRVSNTPDTLLNWRPDTLYLPTTFTPVSFTAGDMIYTVNLLGFFRDGVQVSEITASEHLQPLLSGVSADLMARIDAVPTGGGPEIPPVPEPSSLLLLGGCAVSSIVWGRKRLRFRGGAR